jgi:hypothetical protein
MDKSRDSIRRLGGGSASSECYKEKQSKKGKGQFPVPSQRHGHYSTILPSISHHRINLVFGKFLVVTSLLILYLVVYKKWSVYKLFDLHRLPFSLSERFTFESDQALFLRTGYCLTVHPRDLTRQLRPRFPVWDDVD